MSGEAMLAVVDTIRSEVNKEFQSFTERTKQHESIPFAVDRSSSIYRRASTINDDSIQAYQSSFEALNLMEHPQNQIAALNLAINSLNRYRADVDSFRSNIDWRNLKIAEFWVEIHKKLSIPFACILFVMIGAPIGMLTRNGNIGIAALSSAVILTIYFIAIIQGEKLADRGIISPFMGMWGINILYFIIGSYLMVHVCTAFRITNLFQPDE